MNVSLKIKNVPRINNKCTCQCKNSKEHRACEKGYFGILQDLVAKMINIKEVSLTIQ